MNDVWALLRLSRPELDKPGSVEEKFAQQKAMALDMARRYDLELPDDHILVEQVSGQYLKKRAELQRLIDLMHAGRCRYLISPAEDRIDRLQDKRDQADLEDAFYAGAVTVISRDGVVRYDDDLDPFGPEIRAAFARHEARKYSVRMREKKAYRLSQNKPNSGVPLYGYRKTPKGMSVNEWRVQNGLDPVEKGGDAEQVYEAEYPGYGIMEEVFRRLLARERLRAIWRDIVAREIPSAGHGKRKNAAQVFDFSTLCALVHNPIYAGYHARRTKPVRNKGYRLMKPEDFILAEGEPGPWPKPITLAEHLQIRAMFSSTRNATHLLTGLLYCSEGSPMRSGGGRSYVCHCPGTPHNARRSYWEEFARKAWEAFIDSLPDHVLEQEPPRRQDNSLVQQEYARSLLRLREKQVEYDRLVKESVNPESLLRRFDSAEVSRIIEDVTRELEQARAQAADLELRASMPSRGEALSLLQGVRRYGAGGLWNEATDAEKRELLRVTIARIQLHPRERQKFTKGADIVWQDWITESGLEIPVDPEWYPRRVSNRDYSSRKRDADGRFV